MTAKYLDLEGLQFFYDNLKRVFRTASQVDGQIDAKIATWAGNAIQIVQPSAVGGANVGANGIIYIADTVTGDAPNEVHSYESYVYEGGEWIKLAGDLGDQITALATRVGHIENLFNINDQTGAITCDATVTDGSTKAVSGGAVKTYVDTAIADYVPLSQKGANNGVATLGADGKIPNGQLPDLAITNVITKANLSEYNTFLTTSPTEDKVGDVVVVTDYDGSGHPKTFIITEVVDAVAEVVADPTANPPVEGSPAVPAHYNVVEISAAGYVTSVAGKTGDVSLALADLTDCDGYASGSTELSSTTTTTGKVVDPAGVKAIVDDYGYGTLISNLQSVVNVDNSTGAVTCDSSIDADSPNAVNSTAVIDYVGTVVGNIQSIENPEIDALFMGEDEVWVKVPDAWGNTVTATVKNGGTATTLTKAPVGDYFVFDVSNIANDADQLVFSDGTNSTLSVANDKAGIDALSGSIIEVTANSATVDTLYPVQES